MFQEWAIAEQKEMEHKQKTEKKCEVEKIRTVDAHQILRRLAQQQMPVQVPQPLLHTHTLENYFLMLSALEDNLVEFKSLCDQLTEVHYNYLCTFQPLKSGHLTNQDLL